MESRGLTMFSPFSLENTVIIGNVEVVSEKNICPPNEQLYPAVGYHMSNSAVITLSP